MEFVLGLLAGMFIMYFALKPSLSEKEDMEEYILQLEAEIRETD